MKASISPLATSRIARTLLLIVAAAGIATFFSACYGPAARHDHRVDRRVDRHVDRHEDRWDRREDRYDRRTDRYYY